MSDLTGNGRCALWLMALVSIPALLCARIVAWYRSSIANFDDKYI